MMLRLEQLMAPLTTQISSLGAEFAPMRMELQSLAGRVASLEEDDLDINALNDETEDGENAGKGKGKRRNSAAQARGILNKFVKT